jgi:hypothetical protein
MLRKIQITKNKFKSFYFVFIFSFLSFACTENIQNNKNEQLLQSDCGNLIAQTDINLVKGWTLFEVTIGESKLEDLISLYGEPYSRRFFSIESDKAICVFQYRFDSKETVFFYGIRGLVCGIEIFSPNYYIEGKLYISLKDLVESYGKPQLVGYSSAFGSQNRTAVWVNKGIQATILINDPAKLENVEAVKSNETKIVNLGYFYQTTIEEYNSTCLSNWYSEQPLESDIFDPYQKDPFDWN